MSFFPKKLSSQMGGIGDGMLIISLITVIGVATSQFTLNFARSINKKWQNMNVGPANSSGIESMVLAYRLAEAHYIEALQNEGSKCNSAKPFLQALKDGAGCPISVTVFTKEDAPELVKDHTLSYTGSGCTITANSSDCGKDAKEILAAPLAGSDGSVTGTGYHFYLNTVRPDRNIAEFTGSYTAAGANSTHGPTAKFAFAIRTTLPNSAHLEVDGRVTQEHPDPLSRCGGEVWANFLVFNPESQKCVRFAQLGSGTGLAFYRGRYFGFRPRDGQIIDLLAASTGTSYLVGEDGKLNLGGPQLFVPYSKEKLINADDITLIADQLYFVSGTGSNAHIGVWDAGANERKRICELGQRGWAQAYEGIAATSFSDPLLEVADDQLQNRMATFFLKTSGGDLLTAVVLADKGGSKFKCSIFKDSNLQLAEYKRTNGFDRTDTNRPYYLY